MKYRIYIISDSMMAATTELVTPHHSSTGTVQLTHATRVKVEHAEELITILSNELDGNSPTIAHSMISSLFNSPLLESSQKSPSLLSHPLSYACHKKSLSVIDSLKVIRASKKVRDVFKTLDFDTLDIQRVKFLPLTFHGDIFFELPHIAMSGPFHMMHGMDKHHDGHAWTRRVTFNIKNDMSLKFCTSTCIGQFHCENQDCKYTSRIYGTSSVNEQEWDGFTVMTIPVGQPPHLLGRRLFARFVKLY